MPSRAETQLLNPLATPDWRHQRALSLAMGAPGEKPKRADRFDDDFTRDLRNYISVALGKDGPAKSALYFKHPDLFVAYSYWEQGRFRQRHLSVFIESRLLSGQPVEAIAKATGCTPGAVEWYEKCWFAVRDRLEQCDWVMNQIIVPTYMSIYSRNDDDDRISPYHTVAKPFVDAGIRLLSYRGGPEVCEYLIRGAALDPKTLPRTPAAARDFIYRQAVDTLGRRCALAAETVMLHADNVAEMFAAFARICEIQMKADAGTGGSAEKSKLDAHMKRVMDTVPWYSQKATAEYLAATPSARYDEGAVEPRTSRLMLTADGVETDAGDMAIDLDMSKRPQAMRLDEMREKMAEAAMGVVAEMAQPSQGRQGDEPV